MYGKYKKETLGTIFLCLTLYCIIRAVMRDNFYTMNVALVSFSVCVARLGFLQQYIQLRVSGYHKS